MPPNLCISFTYQARTEIFASIFSFLTSSNLACSARSGAFHSLLCRRSGTSLIYCFNTERGGFVFLRDAPLTPCCCGGYFLNLLPAVCDEARTQMVGRGTELPHPLRCSTSSIGNIQSKRALGGVRWRVFVAYCLMACNGSTVHDVY